MKSKNESSHPLLKAFCLVVQERRDSLGISQEELAHRAGLHRTYISDIERGSRNISLRSLIRLATALELTASGLICAAEKKVFVKDDEGGLAGGNGEGSCQQVQDEHWDPSCKN